MFLPELLPISDEATNLARFSSSSHHSLDWRGWVAPPTQSRRGQGDADADLRLAVVLAARTNSAQLPWRSAGRAGQSRQ